MVLISAWLYIVVIHVAERSMVKVSLLAFASTSTLAIPSSAQVSQVCIMHSEIRGSRDDTEWRGIKSHFEPSY